MTQENKELLLKDICARLPYNVICKVEFRESGEYKSKNMFLSGVFTDEAYFTTESGSIYSNEYKPYLFPLSSMTKEQQEEFDRIYIDDMRVIVDNITNRLEGKSYETNFGPYKYIDWLNENHFDYRGLIPMELAIDATGLNIY